MLLTNFSNLRIIHTAGANLAVADMLSRDFSSINSTSCQLQPKTLPPPIEFAQLTPNNTLTEIHSLVQREEILPNQKIDSHPILADYGSQKYTLRINDNGNTIEDTPLDSFSFELIFALNQKYKRPVKKQTKILSKQNSPLYETDLDSDDDSISKRIPNKPTSQSSEFNKPIISNPLDTHSQQEFV